MTATTVLAVALRGADSWLHGLSAGEGIPGWASQPNASTRATFPEPLGLPFTNDPATGFPTRQDCAKHGWGD